MARIGSKIKSAQDLLKFAKFGISNMPISILMSKMIFVQYLPPIRLRLVQKLKKLLIYWNLAHFIFWISWSRFWYQKLLFVIYLQIARHKLVPKWKMLWTYWLKFYKNWTLIEIFEKIKIIFDINIAMAIFEISNMPNFNKFWASSILKLIWA